MARDEQTTGMGLWTDANEMLVAARHLTSVKSLEFSQPLYFLLGHSLELSFKSYVRAKGASLSCLKNIGHDLSLGLEWAQTTGIGELVQISEKDTTLIQIMNSYYKVKEFEYRVTGVKKLPHAEDLLDLLSRILSATKTFCAKSVRTKHA